MKYTVKKGNHFSGIPSTYFTSDVCGTATFTEESKYSLSGVDQDDWNKLAGITYTLKPHYNTVLIGWRWNPNINMFQVAPYINEKGKSIQPNNNEILNVYLGDEIYFHVFKNRIYLYPSIVSSMRIIKVANFKPSLISYRVQHYFGGNQAAPSDVSVNINWQ